MSRRLLSYLLPPAVLALVLACSADKPFGPAHKPSDLLVEVTTAPKKGKPKPDKDALSIDDMLGDPLFQALVEGIGEPNVADPLSAAVEALAKGKVARASNLISDAADEADALSDQANPDWETLISWSVIERYLEEAELV